MKGVVTKKLNIIPDERGRLVEILRSDDFLFEKFGQIYVTTAYPGVVKGWHYHKKQSDNMVVIKGMMKIVLYDKYEIREIFAGEHNLLLVHIPPLIYHGFKCISEDEAIVINIPTEAYDYKNPDEFRIDPHSDEIPYNWSRKDK